MLQGADVEAQLQRIVASPTFAGSARSREFLEFCVKRAIRGESCHIKETTIAIEVFLRSADYDPKADPIVRVHARRVREKLDEYYSRFGGDDPIKIEIPKGGYVPQIQRMLPRRKTDFSDWEYPDRIESDSAMRPDDRLQDTRAQSPTYPSRLPVIWGGAILFLICLSAIVLNSRKYVQPAAPIGPLTPVDLGTERASDFAWSPDGRRMAFTSVRKDDLTRIYIEDFSAGGKLQPLSEADRQSQSHPVWSADGHEIAYAQDTDDSHFEVVRYNFATREHAVVGQFSNQLVSFLNLSLLDWSPDGHAMVVAEKANATSPLRLVLVSLATGERTTLTSPPTSSTGDIEPRFSPDGQWIAFHRGGLGDLYVVPVKGEQFRPAQRLTFDNRGIHGIAWTRNGRSIIYSTRNQGNSAFGLAEIPRTGGIPRDLGPPSFDAVSPAISSTGKIAVEHREVSSDLTVHSLDHSTEMPLITGERDGSDPVYSPDGRSVVFTSTRSGCMELWVLKNGTAPARITQFKCRGIVMLPSWSPDGRSIAFSFREHGATNLFVYTFETQMIRQLTFTHNRDINPVFSPDGRYIYYSSNDDGTSRIWRMRSDGSGLPEPQFVEAVTSFELSRDGRWLYFLGGPDGMTVMRRSSVDGSTEEIFHASGYPSFTNNLTIGGGNIFIGVSDRDPSTSDVYEIDPSTRRSWIAARLTNLLPYSEADMPGFSVTADGSRLIAAHVHRLTTSLYTARIPTN